MNARFPILPALAAILCLAAPSRADEIDDLVPKLGDDSHAVRTAATRDLAALRPSRARLEKLMAATDDPEIRMRLNAVMGSCGELWEKLPREGVRMLKAAGGENGQDLYLARVVRDGGTVIGKYMPEWGGGNFPVGEKEELINDFTVWVGGGSWKPWHPGLDGIIVMGKTKDGKAVHAARAKFANGLHPGTFVAGEDRARISWGGGVHLLGEFEVLTVGFD